MNVVLQCFSRACCEIGVEELRAAVYGFGCFEASTALCDVTLVPRATGWYNMLWLGAITYRSLRSVRQRK